MIDLINLNMVLQNLSKEIKKADTSCSVIQFGSSIYGKVHDKMDIDLLVMSEHDYFGNQYQAELIRLKQNLLSGGNNSILKIDCSVIEEKVNNVIADEKHKSPVTFIPKFIFGPYIPDITEPCEFAIFLHFKGPITKHQLIEFCRLFPFHAKSIIHNSKIIVGSFDASYFDKHIVLKQDEFNLLSNALRIRVENSNSCEEVKRCIKKFMLNFNLLNGVLTNDENIVFSLIETRVNFNQVLSSTELSFLKEHFLKMYNKIMF